jgi:pimeloyl-ACP methyl ester carboxylesterase
MLSCGYHAVVPRMPGHGFAVGGLVQADWEDWAAAVRIAVRHAQTLMAPGQPLVFVGYSNGALLAVHYALRCDDDESSPCPDSLILLSPAIAVTSFARLANLHHGVSWLPYFDKFEWQDILPEVDPFKFTSFPKNAGWQTYQLSRRTRRLLADPERVARLPPILTFQSIVDATVSGAATVDFLYNALAENGSELVVYDVNRSSTVLQMMSAPVDDPVDLMLERAPLNFSVTVLSNRDSSGTSGTEVGIIRLPAGQNTAVEGELGLVWPPGVFSLSHIAIPFRPADPLYGDGSDTESGLVLGALAPRGERSVLALTPNYFLRLRYNPFYDFQATRIQSWLGVLEAE